MKPNLNQIRGKIEMVINSIKAFGDEVKKVEIDAEQVAEQYLPVINDAKNTLLSAIQKETSEKLPDIKSFDDVAMLYDRAKRLLNRLGDTSGSHSKILHTFFGKYAKVLKFQLGLLSKEVKHMDEIMGRYKERESVLSECSSGVARITNTLLEISDLARKREDTEKELGILEGRQSELVRKIDGMRTSESYSKYRIDKEELANVRKDAENVLAEIYSSFSRISRPLSKYTYEVGLDKESNYLIQSVMESPLKLVHGARTDQLIDVLNKVRSGVHEGKIVVKNPDKDLENMDMLIGNIRQYVDAYKSHHAKVQILTEKTSAMDAELDRVNGELERVKGSVTQKKALLDDYTQKLEHVRSSVSSELNRITERIDMATGSRIKIKI